MVAGALAAALPIRRLEASGTSSFAFILILISSTAVASAWLALSATGRFDAIETTAPVARSRAVTLADYVAPRRRAANWIGSGLALLLATGAVVAQQMTSRLDGLATGALVAACVVAFGVVTFTEVVGRRLSDLPEPAGSAAHLYAQDAFRSSLLGDVFAVNILATQMLWLGSSLAVSRLSDPDVANPWVDWIIPFGLGGIGVMLAYLQGPRSDRSHTPWFRHRLWPTLEPDLILEPGDELPARPRAHA